MIAISMDVGGTRGKAGGLPLACAIARDLGILILSGRYKPGDVISGEVDASKQLRVSRATYREAMHILCAKGLVERRQRAGTRVTPAETWHWLDPDILRWTFECEDASRSLSSFFELRRTIEPEVAALAARRHTAEHLKEMRRALDLMDAHMRKIPLRQFRASLFRASQNPYFAKLGDVIESVATTFDQASSGVGLATCEIRKSYVELFKAITGRDSSRARHAMCDIVELAGRHVFQQQAKQCIEVEIRAHAVSV